MNITISNRYFSFKNKMYRHQLNKNTVQSYEEENDKDHRFHLGPNLPKGNKKYKNSEKQRSI